MNVELSDQQADYLTRVLRGQLTRWEGRLDRAASHHRIHERERAIAAIAEIESLIARLSQRAGPPVRALSGDPGAVDPAPAANTHRCSQCPDCGPPPATEASG